MSKPCAAQYEVLRDVIARNVFARNVGNSLPLRAFPASESLASFKTNYVSMSAATLIKWRRDVNTAQCETDRTDHWSVGSDR